MKQGSARFLSVDKFRFEYVLCLADGRNSPKRQLATKFSTEGHCEEIGVRFLRGSVGYLSFFEVFFKVFT